ncbi:hypothetical protein DPMN_112837 [Dreissena polymorpha]|uniref:Uncharacterized protein n=1 Tax=Dreissena polymorpha TaxID=45954 RepID=A0A9D4KGE3_DREPO|nr:hypothetical protein DPMN_112837 [Dreissena polymorpha]
MYNFSELLEANRRYKEEVRRLARVNTPFETTDIGRIQKLVQKIMLNSRGVPKHHLPKEDEKPEPIIG